MICAHLIAHGYRYIYNIYRQVTVLTSSRRAFILTNPRSFFTLQLAFTTSAISSGAFPGALLFLVKSLSISSRSESTPGKSFPSAKDIRVSSGANRLEFKQQPCTVSFVASGWIKLNPSRSLWRMSSALSHSSHMPSTSNCSFSIRLTTPFRFMKGHSTTRKTCSAKRLRIRFLTCTRFCMHLNMS